MNASIPVLLLGGAANSVAVARSLSRLGVDVGLSATPDVVGRWSRHCRRWYPVPPGERPADHWRVLLLSDGPEALGRHVVFPLCDSSVEFVCQNHAALAGRHILDECDPDLGLAMLDKQATVEIAQRAGVPTPRFWPVSSLEDLDALRPGLRFPLIVKPIHSHLFSPVFGRKYLRVDEGHDELREKVGLVLSHGIDVMLVEFIPGPDSLMSSYYTYVDSEGESLFEYTKLYVRRYPMNEGGASYQRGGWCPDTAEAGRRMLSAMGWRGMAMIEFKWDARDEQLKLIEVNPRFTGSYCLLARAGATIDQALYLRLTGQEAPALGEPEAGVGLWDPVSDFRAFLELRRRGELSFFQWLASLSSQRKMLPLFRLSDPLPAIVTALGLSRRIGASLMRRLGRSRMTAGQGGQGAAPPLPVMGRRD